MLSYVIRRLLFIIPTLLLVTLFVFLSVRFIPGDVIDQLVATMPEASAADLEEMKVKVLAELGLDQPIHVQYGKWIWGLVQGDFGNSIWSGNKVSTSIVQRLPVTLELGIIAIFTSLIIAIPVGVISAIRQDSFVDYTLRTIAILFISVPGFWLATIIIVYGSILFGWVPPLNYIKLTENLWGNILQFLLPGVLMGMVLSGSTMRMTRTMMLEVLREDYIRTAWAKGLKERTIVYRHAIKNALIPVVTIIGGMTHILVAGSVVIEQIFALPGIGRLLVEALTRRDYPVISGVNIVVSGFVMVVNLVVDIIYAYVDPRVKY